MAGGQGTRGRPYTEYFPKAMTPISDKPLIDYIIRYIMSFEFIDQIIVITDLRGLGGQIRNYYGTGNEQPSDSGKLVFVQDSQSGTGGDLLHVYDMISDDEPFVLWFADNLCAVDLDGMLEQFRTRNSTACIAIRNVRPEETGFALVDDNGIVSKFVEKPTVNLPLSECLGVYILHHSVLSNIKDVMGQKISLMRSTTTTNNNNNNTSPRDISESLESAKPHVNLSHDILESLSKKGAISAFDIGDSQWVDAESPVVLERNKSRVDKIISTMRATSDD